MNYGQAIQALQAGKKVAREGWNGNKVKVVSDYPKHIPIKRMELREDLGLVFIRLSNNEVAVCDASDYEIVNKQEKWSVSHGYPYFTDYSNNKKTTKLHNLLFPNLEDGLIVDHINGNKLDNRRENLRIVNSQQNNVNRLGKNGTSEYKGVSFDSSRNKWISSIQVNGKTIHIGRFETEIEAAKAYDKESFSRYGEYAKINFPEEINKSNMYVFLTPDTIVKTEDLWNEHNKAYFTSLGVEEVVVKGYLGLKNADNTIQPGWIASTGDTLAEDWQVVE